jgi:hypothetical protein
VNRPASFLATLLAVPAVAGGQSRHLMSGDDGSRRFPEEWGHPDVIIARRTAAARTN